MPLILVQNGRKPGLSRIIAKIILKKFWVRVDFGKNLSISRLETWNIKSNEHIRNSLSRVLRIFVIYRWRLNEASNSRDIRLWLYHYEIISMICSHIYRSYRQYHGLKQPFLLSGRPMIWNCGGWSHEEGHVEGSLSLTAKCCMSQHMVQKNRWVNRLGHKIWLLSYEDISIAGSDQQIGQ